MGVYVSMCVSVSVYLMCVGTRGSQKRKPDPSEATITTDCEPYVCWE